MANIPTDVELKDWSREWDVPLEELREMATKGLIRSGGNGGYILLDANGETVWKTEHCRFCKKELPPKQPYFYVHRWEKNEKGETEEVVAYYCSKAHYLADVGEGK